MGKVTFTSNQIGLEPTIINMQPKVVDTPHYETTGYVAPIHVAPQLVHTIEYRDVIKEVIVEKIVEIEKPVEIVREIIKEIPVEKIVTVYQIVEKPVEKIVEKEVIVRVENPIDFIKCQENRDLMKKTNNQKKAIQALGLISVTLLILLMGALIYGK